MVSRADLLLHLVITRDRKNAKKTMGTIRRVITGKKISAVRLKAAQNFLADLLEELNLNRPPRPIRCGGK